MHRDRLRDQDAGAVSDDGQRDAAPIYRALFDQAPDGMVIIDERGQFIAFNDTACADLGYSRKEFSGLRLSDLAPLETRDAMENLLRRVQETGYVNRTVTQRTKEGAARDVAVTLRGLDVPGRTVFHVRWRSRPQQAGPAAMPRPEDTWKFIFEFAPDGYIVADLEGTFLYANRKAEELAGRGRNELIGMSLFDEAQPFSADAATVRTFLERAAQGEASGPTEVQIARNGERTFLEITAHPVAAGHAQLLLCIIRDTTERRRYEESLKNTNARLQALVQAIPDLVFFKDTRGRYVLVNKAVEAVTGMSGERLAGMSDADHMPADAAAHCAGSDAEALRGDRPIRVEECLTMGGNGQRHYFDIIKAPIHDAAGELLGLVAVCRDVTERRRMEEALRKSEKFIRDILESVDEGFIVIDRDFRIIAVNKAYLGQVKMPLAEVVGRKCHVISHGSSKACHERGEVCAVRRTFETGEPSSALHVHRDREQDLVYVEIKSYPLKDEEGTTIAAIEIINNVTDKKRLEEQLRHAQKMEAVGQLAGGIAHDFNNILTTIIGYGSLLKRGLAEGDPLQNDVGQILDASERASNLTRSLLTFSRKQAISPYPVNVNEIIGNMERLLRRIIGENVAIVVQLEEQELIVMADVSHFEQVLMNLATNAKDAMPAGGSLTITTRAVLLDKDFIGAHGFGTEGAFVCVTVADTGVGLDEKTKARIFEPFFTTKARGKGTGLGLSIVYGIVKQHGGYITCESQPGNGTRFCIYLPLQEGDDARPARKTAPLSSGGGNETILLVEDDADVRRLMKSVLQRSGYVVIEAADGDEAIEKFREHRDEIRLLLLDVIMPKKNGKEAYMAIEKERPGMPAIFVSGYTADIMSSEGVLEKGLSFLPKPVSPAVLLRKVRECLDGRKGTQ